LTRNTERLLLLDIMVTGKTESRVRYRERLENYIQNSQDEKLVELARNMLKPLLSQVELAELNPKEIEEDDSSQVEGKEFAGDGANQDSVQSPYTFNESATHIFVIVMEPSQQD